MHYTVCDYLLDILQNSIEADSSRILLDVREDDSRLDIILQDDGKGMTPEELSRARDPFYTDGKKHKGRKVGLGIPFLEQVLAMTGGSLDISSRKGEGTVVKMFFNKKNIDTPPLGHLPETLQQSFCFDGDYEMVVTRSLDQGEPYEVSRLEMKEVLGDLNQIGSMGLLLDFLNSQEQDING